MVAVVGVQVQGTHRKGRVKQDVEDWLRGYAGAGYVSGGYAPSGSASVETPRARHGKWRVRSVRGGYGVEGT